MKKDSAAQIKGLKQQLLIARAGDIGALSQAYRGLDKVSKEIRMASGVVLTITDLSGEEIVGPVVIPDGLSMEVVKMLREEVYNASERRIQRNRIVFKEKVSE